MPTTFIWDELDSFKSIVTMTEAAGSKNEQKRKEVEDILEDILVMAYLEGISDAEFLLGVPITANTDRMQEAVYKKIAGKVFRQRVSEYVTAGTVEDIQRVAETDATRIYNTAVMDAGKQSGISGLKKQWVAIEDERTRDTHSYLDGTIVGINDDFYSYSGDHAPYPGAFETAEENCNCRCVISLIR